MQLAHRDQDRPAGQLLRGLVQVDDGLEAGVLEEVEELVLARGASGPADRAGGFDHQRGMPDLAVQDETAGDAENGGLAGGGGLVGAADGGGRRRGDRRGGGDGHGEVRGTGLGLADAADGADQLLLGDRHHLGGDAAGVREGEHGGLVTDEQHGAGRFHVRVAGGPAGGALVAVRGSVAAQ